MTQLVAIIAGVGLLCFVGATLGRRGGAIGALGHLLVAAGGIVTALALALIVGLAVSPGACVAVLCPDCYRAPAPDQVWRAGVVYFVVLGGLGGLLPGEAFRAGYGVGVLVVLPQAAAYWAVNGAGATVLLGLAAFVVAWLVRCSVARWIGSDPGDPGGPISRDFWDGTDWRASPTAMGGR